MIFIHRRVHTSSSSPIQLVSFNGAWSDFVNSWECSIYRNNDFNLLGSEFIQIGPDLNLEQNGFSNHFLVKNEFGRPMEVGCVPSWNHNWPVQFDNHRYGSFVHYLERQMLKDNLMKMHIGSSLEVHWLTI